MSRRTLDRRRAGVLLHPASLPGGVDNGDLGPDAHRFIDWLADAGFSVWQMLPVGPTHRDRSPYQSFSVHAGNPQLISLDRVQKQGWLTEAERERTDATETARVHALRSARKRFEQHAEPGEKTAFVAFVNETAHWLEDYALFQALRAEQGERPWWEWPAPLRTRDAQALQAARQRLAEAIGQQRFEQYLFFSQWWALRDHARSRGVKLFGDLPIFVAHDSAEVWARPDLFMLDEEGHARFVAGVPPDYFAADGQRWGNPLYNWDRMTAEGFTWWEQRLATQLRLFDWVRVDHFRGFQACWQIPASSATAREGRWVEVPGEVLFEWLHARFESLPLIAEDLGHITPEVHTLRRRFGLPGMCILQFAFDGDSSNPYLPHNHRSNRVVYTGTHDNDTTVGWYAALPEETRQRLLAYLGHPQETMPWPLIRAALRSVARLAVVPLQDLLALDREHRMNTPGTSEGNWNWRFEWSRLEALDTKWLAGLLQSYGR
ncbi:MAG: 4-alpha-glucanotransferase [Proteobacteria bacterium]|nr:MAG: 4-alpha-glucanotransferase [Pseudomonadota bacterium]QKK11852.1 MAG: 4-alpha-glucanotransferase [Pseudomonadota bacterium]